MSHLLDTNTCICALKGNPAVVATLRSHDPSRISVSAITLAELWYGARRCRNPAAVRALQDAFLEPLTVYDFDAAAADQYADIRQDLEKRGRPIGERDQLIASIARAHGLTLVTNNVREFRRVRRLRVEDWSA